MSLKDIKDKKKWVSALKAPLIPAGIFSLMAAIGIGTMTAFVKVMQNYASGTELLGSAAIVVLTFLALYIVGLLLTVVFGVLMLTILPPNIPILSKLNSSRGGRLLMIFAMVILFGFLEIGSGVFLLVFLLLCLGEYTKRLPDNASGSSNKTSAFY